MADIAVRTETYKALTTATRPSLHVAQEVDQFTGLAGEAITIGAPVYIDGTTGRFLNGDASAAGTAGVRGIALRSAAANKAVTYLSRGIVEGPDLSALAYGAPVYLSDTTGRLGTTAGTTSVVVGYVVGVRGDMPGQPMSKLLKVTL